MPAILTRTLIVCLLALPAFVCAAEPASEPKALPAPTVAPVTPAPIATAPVAAAPVAAAPADAALKAASALPTVRIGYVDFARFGTDSERGKALKNLLMTRKDKLQTKIDAKKKQIEKLKTAIETKLAAMTPPQREAKSKEFQKKLEEFQKFARASEEELFALQDKETKVLYEEIEKSAAAYGKANGFMAIAVKKELLYVGGTVETQDITDALIKALNQADLKK
jgi:outer membrane protein